MTSKTQPGNLPMRQTVAPVAAVATRYPFVPYGLVPIIGLLLLFVVALVPFAFGEVQAVTEA